jgi:alkyl hydroperoxide reductase subunit AhpC
VVFVYPGPTDGLQEHAQAFTANRQMPPNFRVLIDPDYAFTFAYGLRWNAPQETAYPATFVLDPTGTVRFVRVSREHGDRVPAAETIKVLAAMRHTPGQRQPSGREE